MMQANDKNPSVLEVKPRKGIIVQENRHLDLKIYIDANYADYVTNRKFTPKILYFLEKVW